MVGHHARHDPTVRLMKEYIDAGRLGRVCNVLTTSCSSAGLVQVAGDWRVEAGRNPGGPLLQCGIHTLDTLLGLFGPADSVSAMMQDDVTPFEVEDNALVLIGFRCGVQAAFLCNYCTAYLHTVRLMGTEANLYLHKHVSGLKQAEMYVQRRAGGEHEPWEALRIPADGSYPDPHGGVLERAFAEQVRTGQPDYANLGDAIDALRIVEAAVESHRQGRRVSL
jgi:predicted dehydrogenase